MNEPLLPFLLSLSVSIPAIIGFIRFKKIDPAFYPFVYAIWAGLFSEIISYVLIKNHIKPAFFLNIYILTEFILLLWFFKNLGTFSKYPERFYIILFTLTGIWITENFIIGSLMNIQSLFRISYSVVLVLLGINEINKLVLTEKKKNITRNPIFIICVGIIILYSFKILIEIFWIYAFNNFKENKFFRDNVYAIFQYINVIVNLVYALALLWIQKKKIFTKPS